MNNPTYTFNANGVRETSHLSILTKLIWFAISLNLFNSCENVPIVTPGNNPTGTLIDSKYNVPIPNLTFTLQGKYETYTTTTDSVGNFWIDSLYKDAYTIFTKYEIKIPLLSVGSYEIFNITDTLARVTTDDTNWNIKCSFLGEFKGQVNHSLNQTTKGIIMDNSKDLFIRTNESGYFYVYVKPDYYNITIESEDPGYLSQNYGFTLRSGQTVTMNKTLYSTPEFYPLEIGNEWHYNSQQWSDSGGGLTYNSSKVYKVIGDTIFRQKPNYSYSIIEKNGSKLQYKRMDTNSIIYEYDPSTSSEFIEADFNQFKIGSHNIFGQNQIALKKENTSGWSQYGSFYVKGIGLAKEFDATPYHSITSELTYAKINGIEYSNP